MQLPNLCKITAMASTLLLCACGGGSSTPEIRVLPMVGLSSSAINSSSASSTIAHNKLSQTLSFPENTSGHLYIGPVSFTNQAIAKGTGVIHYESNHPDIVAVDENGKVTVYPNVGTYVTITATIAADDQYQAATASYTVYSGHADPLATPPSSDINFSAWIGEKDSLVNFSSTATGFTFYSSSDSDCDFTHVVNCTDGQFALLNGSQLRIPATTLEREGKYLLSDGQDHTPYRMIANITFEPRAEHQTVAFNNSLWMVGGLVGATADLFVPDVRNDTWSSVDGISWIQQTANAGFSTRIGEQLVAFNNALWLIGGNDRKVDYLIPGDDNGRKNDIWSSSDGINWTQQISHASFTPRADHAVVSFNNKLWLIGGNDKTGNKNDIWSSSNGISWVKQASNANFSARSNLQIVVFNNKLWLIGNSGSDVWSSSDGVKWQLEALKASFSPREDHKVVVHNNKLWLVAGYEKNDVWSSVDGSTWVQQTEHAAFSPRNNFQLVSFANKLMIIGGSSKDGLSNEVWSSSDGIEWRKGFSSKFEFAQ